MCKTFNVYCVVRSFMMTSLQIYCRVSWQNKFYFRTFHTCFHSSDILFAWTIKYQCSDMARVNEGSHSFIGHPHVYPQVEWTISAFIPQPQSITALWLVLISVPLRVEGWVGLSGWLQTEVVYPPADSHPSQTNRRRVTSLIETNRLPLSQAAITTCLLFMIMIIFIHQNDKTGSRKF